MSNFKFPPAVTGLECLHQGKVRDTFAIPGHPDLLLTVATDRVSTHNVVHHSEVPKKGYALTALTVFWMSEHLPGVKTHLIAFGNGIFKYLPKGDYPDDLLLRALVIRRLNMIPVEFIFRSRMAGSLWKDYYQKDLPNPYGHNLPSGLQLMSPFEHTIFTPTDKSETDDPLPASAVIWEHHEAYELARRAYEIGREFANACCIDIIDGKFEVGFDSRGQVVLADECLTPDSCRFVRGRSLVVGEDPPWLDKQYLREEAERIWTGGKKTPITFSPSVLRETTVRYEDIVDELTGASLMTFQATRFR